MPTTNGAQLAHPHQASPFSLGWHVQHLGRHSLSSDHTWCQLLFSQFLLPTLRAAFGTGWRVIASPSLLIINWSRGLSTPLKPVYYTKKLAICPVADVTMHLACASIYITACDTLGAGTLPGLDERHHDARHPRHISQHLLLNLWSLLFPTER